MIVTYHTTIDLAGALRRTNQELRGLLRTERGEALSGWAVRRELRRAQAKGYTVFPCCAHINATGHCLGHVETTQGDAAYG